MGALDDLDKALGAKGFGGGDDEDKISVKTVDFSSRSSNLGALDDALTSAFGESGKQQTQAPLPATSPVKNAKEPTGFFATALNAGKTAAKFGLDAWNAVVKTKDAAINFAAEPLSRTPLIKGAAEAYNMQDRGEVQLDTFQNLAPELLKGFQDPVVAVLNTKPAKDTTRFLSENSSNVPLKMLAGLTSLGDKTYDQAYSAYLAERNDPENPVWQKFLYELQDSGVQSGIGALLAIGTTVATRSPQAGLAVSGGFYTALSADEQIQKKGEVYSTGNIAIDVVGDSVLNRLLLGVFKEPSKVIWKSVAQGFGTEGATEVAQSLLKFTNDYGNAKTEEQKAAVLAEAKDYVLSGGMAMEFFVGGVAGGILTGATTAAGRAVNPSQQPTKGNGTKTPPKGSGGGFRVPDEAPDVSGRKPTTEGFSPSFSDDINQLRQQVASFQRRGGDVNPDITRSTDALNDYATTFSDRTIFVPSKTGDAPLVLVSTVEFPDGKFAVRFEANAAGTGFASEFDYNQLFTSKEAATVSAQEAMLAWGRTELESETDPERKAELEEMVDYIDNPRAPVGTLRDFIAEDDARIAKKQETAADGDTVVMDGKTYTIGSVLEEQSDDGEKKYELIDEKGKSLYVNAAMLHRAEEATKLGMSTNELTKLRNEQVKKFRDGGDTDTGKDGKKKAPTQKEKVKEVLDKKGDASIKEVAEETGILEPNVRRILGVGTKEGEFERVADGVYRLRIGDEDIAYIHAADAVKELPRLAAEGFKADMVFLDIPYDTKAVKGGQKGGAESGQVGGGVQYNLISVGDFDKVLEAVGTIARTKDTPVIHMFSQAESGLKDMEKYNDLFIQKGWVPVGRGEYQKLNKNGTFVGRPTGAGYQTSKPEGILVFTQSGELTKELDNLNFKLVRPKGYQTEKPAEMLAQLIEMTTEEGDVVLDPFAGSGVTGAEAVKKGRKTVLIEKDAKVVEKIIKPRVEAAAGERKSKRIGLMDYDPSYTENMKRIIKEAQDNGDTFPYLKFSKEEQGIVDAAFKRGLDSFTKEPRTLAEKREARTTVDLYRGMTQQFDSKFDLTKTDAPNGYSTWTDKLELAKEYAGENGHVYKISLPKDMLGEELVDQDGERALFVNNEKKAGLNGVSGDEYLVYNEHEDYDADLVTEVSIAKKSVPTLAEKRAAKATKPAAVAKKKADAEIKLIEEVDQLDENRPKQLLNKTALRTILGDAKQLDFVVEDGHDSKYLAFQNGNSTGRIRVSAFGLSGDNLVIGQTVRLTKEALKEKGNIIEIEAPTTEPKGGEATIEAFKNSVVQKPVGKLGDAEIVLGTYGANAIARKKADNKQDRIELRELPDTVSHVVEALKAGDSSFRKDNLVLIAQMPTGELRAVVTRQNAAGQEEVINFFRVGKNFTKFVENLRSFGAPARTRTSTLALEPRSPIQLAYGGSEGTVAQDASGSIEPPTLSGGKFASAGVWSNGEELLDGDAQKPAKMPKKEEVEVTMGGLEYVHAVEMPELVQLARDLMGRVPDVVKKSGKAAGRFTPKGGGQIKLVAELFAKGGNHLEAARTLAHEIGHLIDWLDDMPKNIGRGNLLGRLFTLRKFMGSTFSSEGETFTTEERAKVRNGITKAVLEEKGIAFGDMVSGKLDPKVKKELANEVKKRYKKEVDAAIKNGGFIKDATLRKELLAVTRWWHPYDPKTVPESYRSYRESSVELYAEALSVLLNAPTRLQQMAPTFYNEFFSALDEKPNVRDAYFELQSLLAGDRDILTQKRREGVQKMFADGDYKALDLEKKRWAEREERRKRYWSNFKHAIIDKGFELIDRVKEVEKSGKKLNPDENPVFFLEERNYLGGKIKSLFESQFNTVYQDVTATHDIPWEQFGEYLFYTRIAAGDRSDVANPRGITPDAATELIEKMRSTLGDENLAVLEANGEKFRAAIKSIATEAYESGLYTKELYDQMQANPAYVTFQVLDHLEDGMTSRVYKSVGTLKDIANPADSSMLKVITTIRAIERNNVSKSVTAFLEQNFAGEIEEAKYVFNGKTRVPVQPKKENQELLTFFEDGKMRGVYVDKYIAESVNNESVGRVLAELSGLRFMNSTLFRPLFITFNLGFQSFNLIRDFVRFYKNIPDMTLARAVKRYAQSARIAKVRAFGASKSAKDQEALALLIQLEDERVFSVTFGDIINGETEFDSQVQKILADTGIKEFQPEPKFQQLPRFAKPTAAALEKVGVLKVTNGILDTIKKMGDFIETLPKAAGVYEYQSKSEDGKLTREQRSYVRRKLGSPDFLAGGTFKPITNEVFLFSNAIIQGIRADVEVATDPTTRSAFWWKTAKVVVIPKLLMFAALLGLFGRGLKDMFEDASEYDRTNYTIIPLGKDENDKTIYFRLPADETSRFIGGLMWKMLRTGNNEQTIGQELADLVSYTGGQLPSLSPTIGTATAIAQYVSGQNPYDAFRGRQVLSDDTFKAGGIDSVKAFSGWVFQQMGGGIFYRFYHEPTAPREQSGAEKFVNLPFLGNVVGRFVRVSDYGQQEKLKGIQKSVEKEEAQRRIGERKIVNDFIGQAQERNLRFNTYAIEQEMVKEYLGGTTVPKDEAEARRVKNLIKKFRIGLKRGGATAEVVAIIDADTNDQKIAILKQIKTTMSGEEYRKLTVDLLQQGVVSDAVVGKVDFESR